MKEYFEEAKKWYYVKYIQSLRFILFTVVTTIVAILMSIFAVREAFEAIVNQEKVTKVIFTDYDISLYPVMEKIGQYYHSNDMNILLYTVRRYIENFESYPKGVNQYTQYLQKVKNLQKYSSSSVLKKFQKKFNNEYSKKLEKGGFVRAVIQNVDFDVNQKSLLESITNFLLPTPIPKQVTASVLLYVFDGKKLTKKIVNVEMDIFFEKIQKQKNGNYNGIKFFVGDYRYL